jgi:glycosyltransferase involved in cell wall biosynthesis
MARILQVFNRYLHPGGEEKSVERIYRHASLAGHEVERCFFDSREWKEDCGPTAVGQAVRMFYNPDGRRRFDAAMAQHDSELALFHNLYPVASPALYRAALKSGVPVLQYLHNFRPFSVSGTLYARGQMLSEALQGDYSREVRWGAWQGSVLKSALFAVMLKALHCTRWLDSVRGWIAISEFMRQRIIEAGVQPERIHTLLHSWDAMATEPEPKDDGSYLFLGRLVEEKGIRVLLEAWQQLRVELGEKCPQLVIAGDGPLRGLVESKAGDAIRYAGQLEGETKTAALRACRAVVVPSTWWEPLGLVVYEAYDFAKPVVAARAGGLTETVMPGGTGWLHEPQSAAGLVANVIECQRMSSEQRLSMGRAGRSWLLRERSVGAWQRSFSAIVEQARG